MAGKNYMLAKIDTSKWYMASVLGGKNILYAKYRPHFHVVNGHDSGWQKKKKYYASEKEDTSAW